MSRILAFDTSTGCTSAVLAIDGVVCEFETPADQSHVEELQGVICRLLGEADLRPCDLNGVVIGSGPGSFTGLRIGFSFARAFCQAAELPLRTLPSFFGYVALGCAPVSIALADARRGEVFAGCFQRGTGRGVELLEEIAIHPLDALPALVEKCCAATGSESAEVVVEPGGRFCDGILQREVREATGIARGLLAKSCEMGLSNASRPEPVARTQQILGAQPLYIREVAAKKQAPTGL